MNEKQKYFMPGMEEEVEFLPLIPFEEDSDAKVQYADTMPILPLKNTVLFPKIIIYSQQYNMYVPVFLSPYKTSKNK